MAWPPHICKRGFPTFFSPSPQALSFMKTLVKIYAALTSRLNHIPDTVMTTLIIARLATKAAVMAKSDRAPKRARVTYIRLLSDSCYTNAGIM